MVNLRISAIAAWVLVGAANLTGQTSSALPVPPLVTTAAASALDAAGRPWAYVQFGENQPGLLAARTLAVYAKSGPPESAEPFTFRGLVTHTNDPTALQVLVQRGASLGENLATLETMLTELHRLWINTIDSDNPPVTEPPVMPLPQRLSALLQRAAGDRALAQMLDLIGVSHPAVCLARGTAWAGLLEVPVGSDATLEIRERNAAGADLTVIGRVTVRAGQPVLLPAPGPLVVVPDPTATGDLNVKLRWATSDELRREPSAGVVLWRVDKALAEAQGFDATPPTATALAALAAAQPGEAKQVSPGPISASKLFFDYNVALFDPADYGDPTTHFFTDDNDRARPGGTALPEGTRVYYFAAAVDLLGRPGLVSVGVPAVFCHRLPPPLPSRFTVSNAGTLAVGQYFDVSWLQNTVGADISTSRYEIFRGDDLAFHGKAMNGELDLEADPIDPAAPTAIQRVGVVIDPALDPAETLAFTDTGVSANEANFGRTWWFAIRAVHEGPPGCGEVASTLSPPVFAALRQRQGPEAPNANQIDTGDDCWRTLRVACIKADEATEVVSTEALDPSVAQFRARCERRTHAISAAEFRVIDRVTSVELVATVRAEFAEGEDAVEFAFTQPLVNADRVIEVQCRAVAFDGSLSRWAAGHLGSRAPGVRTANHYMRHSFRADCIVESERVAHLEEATRLGRAPDELWNSLGDLQPGECDTTRALLTVSPDSGRILPIRIRLFPTPGTAEYRIYRRIDEGELSLTAQGLTDPVLPGAAVERFDDAPPVTACTVSYYAQFLDENGNASPMALVWSHTILSPTPPPAPLLKQPLLADMGGTDAAPLVTLTWVCPPQTVARFEVFVHTIVVMPPASPPPVASPAGSFNQIFLNPVAKKSIFSALANLRMSDRVIVDRSFLTGKVGGDFGAGPRFTLPLELDKNFEYTVWLRGIGPNGEIGECSRRVTFRWQPPKAVAGSIPWPARPLPPIGTFHASIAAVDFGDLPVQQLLWDEGNPARPPVDVDETPVGIRVGSIKVGTDGRFFFGSRSPAFVADPGTIAEGRHDPNTQLFQHADETQRLLPCVLYRQQVANDNFPAVSDDVIQCSPLISSIAWTHPDHMPSGAELVDPFFRWVRAGLHLVSLELYLVDTQPLVGGARYRYWLLRFDARGEPVQTVPCGEVTIREPAP
jgi:hypothetical protein